MEDPAATGISTESEQLSSRSGSSALEDASFWIMAAALKRFVDNEGRGSLPLEVSSSKISCL